MASPTIPATMKAWLYSSTVGGLEKNLKLETDARLPKSSHSLGADQTLVQVLSMSLNPVDYKIAELPIVGRFAIAKPASPGLDFAGRVVSVGSTLGGEVLKPGQLVFGRLSKPMQFGTLGGYVVSERAGTVRIPEGVAVDDAASVGTAGLTAYQSIIPHVKKGNSVFINGGSGGTGIWGIQIAKAQGCHVTTTCSTANIELCKSLGADEVIDYKKVSVAEELKKGGRRFDLVVDNVGSLPHLYWDSAHYTNPGAPYLQVGAEVSVRSTVELIKCKFWPGFLGGGERPFSFVGVKNNRDDFAQVAQWMKEGKVKAVIEEVFAYDKTPMAFDKLKTLRSKGKLVIRVEESGR